ncbi:MAG TPA: helix-turn-helix domain-containing protein [Pseudonocardiaceae bacterium]|jgi:excisionase family DNA binding protein|nr:helix-turn-helix domain-containing protein [Pseudonocardiaceae bacterium]
MTTVAEELTVLPPAERQLAALVAALAEPQHAALVGASGSRVELPEPVYRVLYDVVQAMAKGLAITIAPHNTLLTTQEAADLLGVSRPTLVRLLTSGELAYEQRGRHRRVQLADLLEYQRSMRHERRVGLREMAREGQHAGLYEATVEPVSTR